MNVIPVPTNFYRDAIKAFAYACHVGVEFTFNLIGN